MAREARNGRRPLRLVFGLVVAASLCVSTGWPPGKRTDTRVQRPVYVLGQRPGALEIQGRAKARRPRFCAFLRDSGRSIFAIPLDERRRRLLAIDWVEDASVFAHLAGCLLVRIRERRPVAFAPLRTGAVLVDARSAAGAAGASPVCLSRPARLAGRRPEAARRERVAAFLRFQKDMGPGKDVSEVNVANAEDLRIVIETAHMIRKGQLSEENIPA